MLLIGRCELVSRDRALLCAKHLSSLEAGVVGLRFWAAMVRHSLRLDSLQIA
jgi:hypothetical protein